MAHFAKIVGNVVTQVIVAEQDHIDTLDGTWVQTSYSGNFAGIGWAYDGKTFIPPAATTKTKSKDE